MRQSQRQKRSEKKDPKPAAASSRPAQCQQNAGKRVICLDRARENPERWDGYS